jgi:hypothetical protein
MPELGRGLILGYQINNRSDILELATSYPEHAEDYDKFRLVSIRRLPGMSNSSLGLHRKNS